MKTFVYLLTLFAAFALGAIIFRACAPDNARVERIQRDTVVVRDTIRPPVPEPETRVLTRYDTAYLQVVQTDTIEAEVLVPIEQKTYTTEEYKAVIEGYKPDLLSIEIYTKTVTITKTHSPRWALSVGPGFGYSKEGFLPYIGVHFGIILFSK